MWIGPERNVSTNRDARFFPDVSLLDIVCTGMNKNSLLNRFGCYFVIKKHPFFAIEGV